MPRLEHAAAGFEEQRRHQKVVLSADERHLDRTIGRTEFLKVQGGIQSCKTAAEDDDPRLHTKFPSRRGPARVPLVYRNVILRLKSIPSRECSWELV